MRDDVQQYIAEKYAGEPQVRAVLLQAAQALQLSTTAQTPQQIQAALKAREEAALCIADRTDLTRARGLLGEVKARQFSNEERAMAELSFNRSISGQVKTWTPTISGGTCK